MSACAISPRLGAALVALAAGATAAIVAALLLHRTPGPTPSTSAPTAPATGASNSSTAGSRALPNAVPSSSSRAFPAPPPGAVVFSREDRANAVALAVAPEAQRLRLQASVVGPDGAGVGGLAVGFRVDGSRAATARPCGPGCYAASLAWRGRPAGVVVRVGGRSLPFAMPQTWPPPDASRLVARATEVWRGLRTLVSNERLASDPQHAITTVWRFAAPNRLSYDILGGSSAVVIGGKRWDRQPGGGWVASSQLPELRTPIPLWVRVTNAHLLGTATVQGRRAWRVSFFDPQTQAWFTIAIDRASGRTLDVRMVATAHFMHDAYGPFDRPVQIVPPVGSGGKR